MKVPRPIWRTEFDPRTQLLLLLILSAAVFMAERNALLWMIGFMTIYLFVQGFTKAVIPFLLIAALCYGLQLGGALLQQGLLTFVLFFSFIGLRFVPVMMAAYALSRVPTGKLMAALRSWRLPMGLLIALAVGSRFLPVIRMEFEAIQLSARLRGVSIVTPGNWIRPLRTFEHSIVPLLMRSLKIADELAAAATTKGIDAPYIKTSLYRIAFRWTDMLALAAFAVLLGGLFFYGGLT